MVSFETVCDKVETCQYSVEISVEYLSQSRPMPRSTGVRGDLQIAFINGPQVPRQADGRPDWSSLEARHVAKGGGAAGAAALPPPPWRPGGPFSARAARRKGPTRPREAQFLESLEVLRATRALSERPYRAPWTFKGPLCRSEGPLVRLKGPFGESEGPFERSGRGPFEAPPPPPLGEILATCLLEARPIRAQQAHSRTQVSGRGEFRAMMLSKA